MTPQVRWVRGNVPARHEERVSEAVAEAQEQWRIGHDEAPGSCATCWILKRTEKERDEALATAPRRQGTIDKLTVERDEAIKGDPCGWCCSELLRAQAQRDDERVTVKSQVATLANQAERITELLVQRNDAQADAERETVRADKAESDLYEQEILTQIRGQEIERLTLQLAEALDMRAHVEANARRKALEEVRGLRKHLPSLETWLRAQLAETKTQAAGGARQCPACALLGLDVAHSDGMQCPNYSYGHHAKPDPAPIEAKAERVGSWQTWQFRCCERNNWECRYDDEEGQCGDCGAVWRRPEVGK